MPDTGYLPEGALRDDEAVGDLTVRVLIWFLMGGIFLILLVAIVTVTRDLLAVLAGATTFFALVAAAAAGVLAVRVVRLEARVRDLEARR